MTGKGWLTDRREWVLIVGFAVLGFAIAGVGLWLFPADASAYKRAAEVTATTGEPAVPAPFILVAVAVMLLHIVTSHGGDASE